MAIYPPHVLNNGFCVLPLLLHRRRSTEVDQSLHYVRPYPGLLHYIYIFGSSCPLTEFWPVQKNTSKSYGLVCWQRYCTALQQQASAKLCGVEQRAPPIFGRGPSRWALAHILVVLFLLWPLCVIGQAIIFLPCGFYLSFFFLSSFFFLA